MILKGSRLKLRTFIALTLPQESRQFLSDCVLHLKKSGMSASFTKPSNFHLTLKFLGDTDEEVIPLIVEKLENIKQGKMEFAFTHPGVFPKMQNPRVIWYGVDAQNLEQLASDVDEVASTFGFEPEDKKFVGHMTLARIKNDKPKNLSYTLDGLPKPPSGQHFTSLELIKSELNPSGSIYTSLWQKKLEGEN
jgi:2'-5' RNA ligase